MALLSTLTGVCIDFVLLMLILQHMSLAFDGKALLRVSISVKDCVKRHMSSA